jgi:hypothetical protein
MARRRLRAAADFNSWFMQELLKYVVFSASAAKAVSIRVFTEKRVHKPFSPNENGLFRG